VNNRGAERRVSCENLMSESAPRGVVPSNLWNCIAPVEDSTLLTMSGPSQCCGWKLISLACPPTKMLTKCAALRKREISSLARFDHSCVRNALLEMVKVVLKLGGCASANGIFVAAKSLDFSRQRVIDTDGRLSHQVTCPLQKGFLLDGSLGVEPRRAGIALANGLCDLGGKITSAECLHDSERRACPFWITPWHLPYNWGKRHRIPQ
jgi:hypothetical protein